MGWTVIRHELPPSNPAVLKAETAYGRVLEVRGQYPKAIAFMEQALSARQTSRADSPELADALSELASNHFYAGHWDTCETLFNRVLAMHRRFYGNGHPKWPRT